MQLPELRPDRRVVGDEHRRLRREPEGGRLLQHQIHRLADPDVDDEVRLERLDLQQQRGEIGGAVIERDGLQLDPELALLALLLGLGEKPDAVVGRLGEQRYLLEVPGLDEIEPGRGALSGSHRPEVVRHRRGEHVGRQRRRGGGGRQRGPLAPGAIVVRRERRRTAAKRGGHASESDHQPTIHRRPAFCSDLPATLGMAVKSVWLQRRLPCRFRNPSFDV